MSRVPNCLVDATGAAKHELHGKAGCPARDKVFRKCNRKGLFHGVCLTLKLVAAMEGHSESDDSDVVASLSIFFC